jgi:hypothetical protein
MSARERAEDYRKEAQTCMDLAAKMSLRTDRARMIEMAQHWIDLAERADAKAARGDDAEP